jgi:hypothetical protein
MHALNTYYPAIFSIDCGEPFAGITDGRLWNGWACPLFTLHTIRSIQSWVEYGDYESPLAIVRDQVFMVYENEERTECETIVLNGVKYYAIDGWCWDQNDTTTIEVQ